MTLNQAINKACYSVSYLYHYHLAHKGPLLNIRPGRSITRIIFSRIVFVVTANQQIAMDIIVFAGCNVA